MNKKSRFLLLLGLFAVVLSTVGVTAAFFADKGKILGSSFSVGSADIKLLRDLTGGVNQENLVEDLAGPSFSNISPNWLADYPVKIYNNAGVQLNLTSNANYATANDPAELRQIIFVTPYEWNDNNNNGLLDDGELGNPYTKKTIIKWKTEGYNFGSIQSGEVKSLLLRFSTDAVSPTKQGTTGQFDFEFDTVGT